MIVRHKHPIFLGTVEAKFMSFCYCRGLSCHSATFSRKKPHAVVDIPFGIDCYIVLGFLHTITFAASAAWVGGHPSDTQSQIHAANTNTYSEVDLQYCKYMYIYAQYLIHIYLQLETKADYLPLSCV